MTNIRNYLKALPLVVILLVLAWFVSLQLTKQRVQLEAINKLHNIETNVSPYVWNFESFSSDIVEPFQPFWKKQTDNNQIVSVVNNPQLSLNFSGEVLNTFQHSQLIINSLEELTGTLTLQAKVDLSSDNFYYLSNVPLSGQSISIDLNQTWKGVNKESKSIDGFYWNQSVGKISSLVLQFNGTNTIVIQSVVIPYNKNLQYGSNYDIACNGSRLQGDMPQPDVFNTFVLKQNCWLPSNYMWLKNYVQQAYPGSVLSLDGVDSWQQATPHKINKSYTDNWILNSSLYIFIILYVLSIVLITQIFRFKKDLTEQEKWYKWLVKKMLFKGINKSIAPYHFILNYTVVLVPSALVFVTLMFIKTPDTETFKLLPMYFVWAMFQQFILGYVLAQRIFCNRTQNRLLSSLLAASIFSLLHLPSFHLMLITFIAGVFWAYAWLVFKRFIPLAISHSVLALMYYYIVSDQFLYSAKIFQWFWE